MEPLKPGSPSHHAGYQELLPNPTPENLETRVMLVADSAYPFFPPIILQPKTLARDIRKGMDSGPNVYSIPSEISALLGSCKPRASWYLYVDPPKKRGTSYQTRVDCIIYQIVSGQLSRETQASLGELMRVYHIKRRGTHNGFVYSLGAHIVIHFPYHADSEKFVEAHRTLLTDEPLRTPSVVPVAAAKSHEQKFAPAANGDQERFWERRFASVPPHCPQLAGLPPLRYQPVPGPGPRPKTSVQRSSDSHHALTVGNAEEHNKLLTQLKDLILWAPGHMGPPNETRPARGTLLTLLKTLCQSTDTTKHVQVTESLKKLWSEYKSPNDITYINYLEDLHIKLIECCANRHILALEIVHIWLTHVGLNKLDPLECVKALMIVLRRLSPRWKVSGATEPNILIEILNLLVGKGTLGILSGSQQYALLRAWPALGSRLGVSDELARPGEYDEQR